MFKIRKSVYILIFILVMTPLWYVEAPPEMPEEIRLIEADFTPDSYGRFMLSEEQLPDIRRHTNHFKEYGPDLEGFNPYVLKAVDQIQAADMDGGAYSDGTEGTLIESPIGYPVSFAGYSLIDPIDQSSYCTGATYAALIEALNMLYGFTNLILPPERIDAVRMQETNGSRRDDYYRMWGYWNAPYGNYLSLVLYAGMGQEVHPTNAQPGDFMYYQRASGSGHMVVFLGWYKYRRKKYVVYWSSQKKTGGFGDQIYPITQIIDVKFVRLTDPDAIFRFEIDRNVDTNVSGISDYWE